MKNKFTAIFTKLAIKFYQSIKRFPLPIFMATSTVILLIVLNHLPMGGSESTKSLIERMTLVFALGFPLFLSLEYFLRDVSILVHT